MQKLNYARFVNEAVVVTFAVGTPMVDVLAV
jgi:hypothetical protein